MKYCKLTPIKALLALGAFCALSFLSQTAKAQVVYDSAATAGLKYTVLEVSMNKNVGFSPDADQDWIEKIQPLYTRAIPVFWHGGPGRPPNPLVVRGTP